MSYLREYLPEKIQSYENHPAGREEREQESAMIRKNLAKIDALRSASKATMQRNTSKRAHKEPSNSLRATP